MLLNTKQIMEIIPHRHPFLLVDTIESMIPGKSAVGYKCVTYDEPFFSGHFPDEPVMPGVLQIEACFGAINNARFKRKVVPGDRLRMECEIIKQKGPLGIGKAVATVDGETALTAELTFMIQ